MLDTYEISLNEIPLIVSAEVIKGEKDFLEHYGSPDTIRIFKVEIGEWDILDILTSDEEEQIIELINGQTQVRKTRN